MRYLLRLLWRHLMQYPGRVAVGFLVLMVAAMLMLTLAGAGAAIRFRMGDHLQKLFPEEQLRLEAARSAAGPVAFEGRPIDQDLVDKVRTLGGVKTVWPVEPVRFPIRVQGTIFGQEIASDAVIHGVPRALVEDALKQDESWAPPADEDGTYPVVVSSYFLDLYNLGLARASGLPMLNADYVIGREFEIVMGESAVVFWGGGGESRTVRGKVIGFSADPGLLGLAMPADAVRRFNEEFAPGQPIHYVQLVVQLEGGADSEQVLARARELGLRLSGGDVLGRQLKSAVNLVALGLIGLALCVFGLGILTFYLLFTMIFHARREDLVKLRALGLTPMETVGLALGEVGAIAMGAIVIAAALNLGLMSWVARATGEWVAGQSWIPAGLFAPSPLWVALSSILILAVTICPALPMLRWVVTVEPASVIRDM